MAGFAVPIPSDDHDLCRVVNGYIDPTASDPAGPCHIGLDLVVDDRLFCLADPGGQLIPAREHAEQRPGTSRSGRATSDSSNEHFSLTCSWHSLVQFLSGHRSWRELVMADEWPIGPEDATLARRHRAHEFLDVWARYLISPHRPKLQSSETSAHLSRRLNIADVPELRIAPPWRVFESAFVTWRCPVVLRGACRRWSFDELVGAYNARAHVVDDGSYRELDLAPLIQAVGAGQPLERTLSIPLAPQLRRGHRAVPWEEVEFFGAAQRLILAYGDVSPHPAGYRHATVWHCDLADNFLAQLAGVKEVLLIPPYERHRVGVARKFESCIDNVAWELTDIPAGTGLSADSPLTFRHYRCKLRAGDVLFIPQFWFHNVVNWEPSCAVTSWVLD